MNTIRIRYVGVKDVHEDALYNTGTWRPGDVREIDAKLAPYLLWHDDVWADARNAAARKKEPVVPTKREPVYHLDRDRELPPANLAYMTKDDMVRYVASNFGERLDPSKMTDAQMRAHVMDRMRERA